ncbi:MAG: mechanosensitive ion channel domain-containing protein [Bauldia sp.]
MELAETAREVGSLAAFAWATTIEFLPRLAASLVVLVIGYLVAGWAGQAVRRILARTDRIDATLVPVSAATLRYGILILVAVAVLSQLGIETTSVIAALGAAALAVGLALQGTLQNIAAGIMLLWLRPFHIGDFIEADGVAGTVREVGLFVTTLDAFDGIYRFVPNARLWNTPLSNLTRNPGRMTDIDVTVGYGSDIASARGVMLDLARSDQRVLTNPAPDAFVDRLGESAVVMKYRVWIRSRDFWPTQRYLIEEVKRRLDAAGIEIPPQRALRVVGATRSALAPPEEA